MPSGPLRRSTLLSPNEAQLFFTRLHATYRSGIPLDESLAEIARTTANQALSHTFERVRLHIQQGMTLTRALALEGLLTRLQATLLELAEQSGTLHKVLPTLIEDASSQIALRRTIVASLSYPVLIVLAVFFLMPLPSLFTTGLGTYTGSVALHLLTLTALVGIPFALYRFMSKGDLRRMNRDRLLLMIPLLGRVISLSAWGRFCRSLATGYAAGLDLEQTIPLALGSMNNQALQYQNRDLATTVTEGKTLSDFFHTHNTGIPSLITQMVATGEQSGTLDVTMHKAAQLIEEDARRFLLVLTTVLAAAIFVLAAAYAAYNIIGFYLNYTRQIMQL